MYYNKILDVWVVDALDYFLLSAIAGSLFASSLKDYLSEKKTKERLVNSIIKKSKIVRQSDRSISNSKKIKKIYKFALENRGGQFEEFPVTHEFSTKTFKLAQEIKGFIERLALFLKERELKGVLKILFKNGQLILQLILYTCKINLNYALIGEGLNVQVIVLTTTAGGATGFVLSWISAGAALVAPPVLVSFLAFRSLAQQIVNEREYSKFETLITTILEEDDELKQTLQTVFLKQEQETSKTPRIEMKPWDSEKNPLPEFNFDSAQTPEEFIKARMKNEFGLVENPTPEQISELVNTKKIKEKIKGKTVYFTDFIKKRNENPDNIIDAEIVQETIEVKVKNEKL